ncbi:unnamed protein product [Brugia timori]|uniref:Uncharacterized protein n=1 Tax=Brugia timori TaxID=42155 RepID=A0A3P7T856_9BILA|nr:unnamed protein product [Brugia timori]
MRSIQIGAIDYRVLQIRCRFRFWHRKIIIRTFFLVFIFQTVNIANCKFVAVCKRNPRFDFAGPL